MRLFGDFANLKTGEAKDGLVIYSAAETQDQQIHNENEPNFTMDSVHAATVKLASSLAQKIIATGERYMGVPYNFGAKTGNTSSFDCSSFVQTIYGMYGIKVPRLAGQQSHAGVFVARKNLKPGDLVFFYKVPQMHVAIYIGNGKILHTYGKPGVTISNFNSGWWYNHFTTARRVIRLWTKRNIEKCRLTLIQLICIFFMKRQKPSSWHLGCFILAKRLFF